jgi:sulfopyruvate decarboxylase subunit alpha
MNQANAQRMLTAFEGCKISWLLVVPSTGLDLIYSHYDKLGRCIYVTREEEAIAVASGLVLGGEKPLVLIQQTGVGNTLNAVFTLADAYKIDFPIVVCDRSEFDPNPVQKISSVKTKNILESLGYSTVDWSKPNSIKMFEYFISQGVRWIISPL